jgi:DNA replication protein DnaC
MSHLMLLRQPSEDERIALRWECKKGEPGFYKPQPFNQEPEPGEGVPFVYEGCGWIEPLEIVGKLRRRHCACESKARRLYEMYKQEQDWVRQQARSTYGWLGEVRSDIALLEKTFENFDASRQAIAYRGAKAFADVLSGTLILHGSYGTGKTHLLAALCNEVMRRQIRCLFVTAPKLFQTIVGRISKKESWEDIVTRAIQTPLLVIDDIDKAKSTEHREEVYFAILDERVKAGRPTAISTNKLDELENYVGGACESRLKIGRIAMKMVGEDVRKGI